MVDVIVLVWQDGLVMQILTDVPTWFVHSNGRRGVLLGVLSFPAIVVLMEQWKGAGRKDTKVVVEAEYCLSWRRVVRKQPGVVR